MFKFFIYLICCLMFSSACSMPDTKIYTIQLIDRNVKDVTKYDGKLKPIINICVESPGHLAQPYIITRYSDYQIGVSRYSKWEVPPRDIVGRGIKEVLGSLNLFKEVNIGNINTEGAYLLDINLKRFELLSSGTDHFGEILLDLDLNTPDGNRLYFDRIHKRIKLENNNFHYL